MHTKLKTTLGTALCATILVAAGCKGKTEPDTSNFKTAINNYYSAHPSCLWTAPVKFPAQADTSNDTQTKSYDALVDAGLLKRQAEEKKRFLIGSKQVTNYDVSDQGRSVWVADQSQPGYGNFCYGHREVTTVDTFTTGTDSTGANTATVNYHYDMTGVPAWAKSPETQTAFPNVQADLSTPKTDTASLIQMQSGWQISKQP